MVLSVANKDFSVFYFREKNILTSSIAKMLGKSEIQIILYLTQKSKANFGKINFLITTFRVYF